MLPVAFCPEVESWTPFHCSGLKCRWSRMLLILMECVISSVPNWRISWWDLYSIERLERAMNQLEYPSPDVSLPLCHCGKLHFVNLCISHLFHLNLGFLVQVTLEYLLAYSDIYNVVEENTCWTWQKSHPSAGGKTTLPSLSQSTQGLG